MSAERNKAQMLELIERVMNGHDLEALSEFTSNPTVVGSASGLVNAFPDMVAEVAWIVAEGEMVTAYLEVSGTHLGPWIWVQEPTGRPVTTGLMLALRFDADGQIIDQWLGSNFVAILGQLGWGVAPVGESVSPPERPRQS
jgi:predicted ester cyclase